MTSNFAVTFRCTHLLIQVRCAAVWARQTYLEADGNEIDANSKDFRDAKTRALMLRHLVENECTDILRRLGGHMGPSRWPMDGLLGKRHQELELYLR